MLEQVRKALHDTDATMIMVDRWLLQALADRVEQSYDAVALNHARAEVERLELVKQRIHEQIELSSGEPGYRMLMELKSELGFKDSELYRLGKVIAKLTSELNGWKSMKSHISQSRKNDRRLRTIGPLLENLLGGLRMVERAEKEESKNAERD